MHKVSDRKQASCKNYDEMRVLGASVQNLFARHLCAPALYVQYLYNLSFINKPNFPYYESRHFKRVLKQKVMKPVNPEDRRVVLCWAIAVPLTKFILIKPTDALISQIYFCQDTLHVSGSSSAYHQEFSTVHSALVDVIQVIKPAWHTSMPVPNIQWKTPDDGQRNCPKHVEYLDKINLGN